MSDDTIYRQTAIDAMKKLCENYTQTTSTKHPHIDFIIEELEALPSAQRTGRWIFETLDGTPGYRPTVMFCSKCGRVSIADYSYCPHCGARMEEQE